jgi:integrase
LASSTIILRVASIRAFAATLSAPRGGVRALNQLGVPAIEEFFVGYAKTHGPAATRSMQSAMRLFLAFAAARKWVKRELVGAVPSLRSYRLSGVPRGLDDAGVRELVATSARCSRRDHAIVLLLALYGVRRGHISALRLRDIEWRERTITFRAQKRGKAVSHEVTASVAEALAAYLQHERPKVDSDAVFLRARPPYLPLSPGAITQVIRSLFLQLDLQSRPRSPHALRHGFATRLLGAGQPLEVIADLLGHRSLASVSVYAKVDHPRLLEVAREWPEVAS